MPADSPQPSYEDLLAENVVLRAMVADLSARLEQAMGRIVELEARQRRLGGHDPSTCQRPQQTPEPPDYLSSHVLGSQLSPDHLAMVLYGGKVRAVLRP